MNTFITLIKTFATLAAALVTIANAVILNVAENGKEIMKNHLIPLFAAMVSISSHAAIEPVAPPADRVEAVTRDGEQPAQDAEHQTRAVEKQVRAIERHSKEIQNAARAAADKATAVAGHALELAQNAINTEFDGELNIDFPGAFAVARDHLLMAPPRTGSAPLIIRSRTPDPESQANLQEDLTVMTRLLNKATGQGKNPREDRDWAMGIVVSKLGGPRGPQSIYLEGYGALFMLNVKFPLVAPPEPKAREVKEAEPEDSEWEQAREELFGSKGGRRRGAPVPPPPVEPAVEYDAQQVADLKRDLLEVLKNASKLRQLKGDEWITVAISGSGQVAGPEVRRIQKYSTRPDEEAKLPNRQNAKSNKDVITVFRDDRAASHGMSSMTIRVKKSDAESFAKGKLTIEEFEKKASITAY